MYALHSLLLTARPACHQSCLGVDTNCRPDPGLLACQSRLESVAALGHRCILRKDILCMCVACHDLKNIHPITNQRWYILHFFPSPDVASCKPLPARQRGIFFSEQQVPESFLAMQLQLAQHSLPYIEVVVCIAHRVLRKVLEASDLHSHQSTGSLTATLV